MAEYNGINLTNCVAGKVLDPGVWGGKVQAMHDTVTFASTASGNAAYLGWIPKNARILPNSFVKYGAMGETGSEPIVPASFKVGTLGDDDKFGSVSDAKSAGTFQFTAVDNNKVGESGPLVITIVNAGSGSNVPVEAWIFYVQAG